MASRQALGSTPARSHTRCEVPPERVEQILGELRSQIADEKLFARLYSQPKAA